MKNPQGTQIFSAIFIQSHPYLIYRFDHLQIIFWTSPIQIISMPRYILRRTSHGRLESECVVSSYVCCQVMFTYGDGISNENEPYCVTLCTGPLHDIDRQVAGA